MSSIPHLVVPLAKTEIQDVKPAEFMQGLECLYFSNQNDAAEKSAQLMRLECAHEPTTLKRTRINTFNERDYVAISYTWCHPFPLKQPCGRYSVESPDGSFPNSEVRYLVFERARMYMNRFDLCYLWIDRRCIVQEECEENRTAVQAMDLVYNCSKHPIDLLYQPIMSIAELKLLAGATAV
ncbi:hypothetical protein HD806DRAFT_547039 [Xylariaceae sp. AK1471]|nr:hypothetical protein HD806DRAFT_547039 [Xylariaceae sp. AK1471]